MSERDFEIGGRKFKLRRLDAFKQFHIVRRIGPIMAELVPAMKKIGIQKSLDQMTETEKLDQLATFAAPIMSGMAKLSDADSEVVLFGLLSAVEMQQSAGNWMTVATDKMLMVQDMDFPVLMQIAGRAFMYNLSGFMGAPPQRS